MADCTVTPSALELALAQQAPDLSVTAYPSTLSLALSIQSSRATCSFPTISRKPSHNFFDEKSTEAVLLADTESGYSLLNKLFTFDPRTFKFELPCVSDADKKLIMAFYENHKDVPFPWINDQDGNTEYTVVFVGRPGCRLDGRGDLWKITVTLRQSEPQ